MAYIAKFPRVLSQAQIAKTIEWLGLQAKVTRGTFVTDMAELRKTIMLCGMCVSKFDKKRYGYVAKGGILRSVHGKCDGCGRWENCGTLMHRDTNMLG